MSINDKIKQVLTLNQLSPSQLADDIGVQRSSISHILSGRNRPSLDIIQKIVRCYPQFSYDWFLGENSHMSTEEVSQNDLQPAFSGRINKSAPQKRPSGSAHSVTTVDTDEQDRTNIPKKPQPFVPFSASDKQIDRILIFYTDGTFREFKPS